ncbi:protein angel homolog 2 isoform X2 [Conger conger]|nr:protein angel homolog 2 isoform X2 [Conger conger]
MFTRHLNAVASSWSNSAQASLGWWRSPCLVNPSWWFGQAPWPQLSHHNRHFHVNVGNPGAQDFGTWRQATPRFFSPPHQRAFHLSHGLLDNMEPPHKRRRTSDVERDGQKLRNSPSRSPSHQTQGRGCPNSGIPNGPSPEEIQTCPPNLGQPTEINRQWEELSHLHKHRSKSHGAKPFEFSVMSYNILAQQLLQENPYLYKHCHSSILDWNYRFPNILKELKIHNADILCLQEVQEDHYQNQLKPSLESLGYQCEYKRRTGRKSDGCAVSFKRDRFSLVSLHPVEYFRQDVPILDRDNVGQVLLLHPLHQPDPPGAPSPPGPGPVLCVANTHLLYNPRRGDIKLAQLAVLLAEITRVSRLQDGSACPVVLCGDFNSVPWSPLYNFIRDSRLEYEGIPIGTVSGQEENPKGQRLLPVPIWPQSVGISQHCQYESQPGSDAGDPSLHVADGRTSCPSDKECTEEAVAPLKQFCRPTIAHCLRLTSAYTHRLKDGRQEVTTCHSRTAIPVDYIFYSAAQSDVVQPECSGAPERGLQLLARLTLVDKRDLWMAGGLPNVRNSSDHLPLLTRFRLCP